MSEIKPGDTVIASQFTRLIVTPIVEAATKWRAPKGKCYALIVIGMIDKDKVSEVDPDAFLEARGWKFVGTQEVELSSSDSR